MKITQEEQEHIQRTISMLEEAVRANPADCESLEILKEAYAKVDRAADLSRTMRQLADSYMQLGQYSSALIEYAALLQNNPDSAEVKELMQKAEERLDQSFAEGISKNLENAKAARATGLTEKVFKSHLPSAAVSMPVIGDDGNDPLVKFLVQNKIVPVDQVHSALAKVRRTNKQLQMTGEMAVSDSLLGELVVSGVITSEELLGAIISRNKMAYIPLEYYDIDRQIVKMLPEQMTLGRLIVPFDVVSRTMMVATVNPFDASGKSAIQRMVDYHVQWYLCSPDALTKALHDAYRIETGV